MVELTDIERTALDYCAPRGIPLSVFLGRVVGNGEAQWLTRDTQAALWWQREQSYRCVCGHDRRESMSEEGPEYEVTLMRCFACQARDAKNAEIGREKDHTAGYGMYVYTSPVDEPQDA